MKQKSMLSAVGIFLFLTIFQTHIFGSESDDFFVDYETVTTGSSQSQSEGYFLQSGFIGIGSQGSSTEYWTETINLIPQCGNGIKENEEVCDDEDFGGITCESSGYAQGELQCENHCTTISYGDCIPFPSGGGPQNYGGGYENYNPPSWGLEDQKQKKESEDEETQETERQEAEDETTEESQTGEEENEGLSETDESEEDVPIKEPPKKPVEVEESEETPEWIAQSISPLVSEEKNGDTEDSAIRQEGVSDETDDILEIPDEEEYPQEVIHQYHFTTIEKGGIINTSDPTPLISENLLPDTTYDIFLTDENGEQIFSTTLTSDKKGHLVFTIRDPLPDGVYRLRIGNEREGDVVEQHSIVIDSDTETLLEIEFFAGQYIAYKNTNTPYDIGVIDPSKVNTISGKWLPEKEVFAYFQKVDQEIRRIGMANITQEMPAEKENIIILRTKTDIQGRFAFDIPSTLEPGKYRVDIVPMAEEKEGKSILQKNIAFLFAIDDGTNGFVLTPLLSRMILIFLGGTFFFLVWKKRKKESKEKRIKKRTRKK